ncbi:hypothetical protein BOX15_Mlig033729g1 [Macrostomum lignano]|uniref:Uncharacterized protein n=1 Tax=Macrostomum lignano TaxID=282301 RepID=A0A267GDE8_9PLAT|nr:hypothetical protein BOX15_Mlig033729g1 [Macrostomum lignano]
MHGTDCCENWPEREQQEQLLQEDAVNWKDCIHRWKCSREKWRQETVKLQSQLYDMTHSAFHWRKQVSIVHSGLTKMHESLLNWQAEAHRCREASQQWRNESYLWREQAQLWKKQCSELMERVDNHQIAQLHQARHLYCAQMRQQYEGQSQSCCPAH